MKLRLIDMMRVKVHLALFVHSSVLQLPLRRRSRSNSFHKPHLAIVKNVSELYELVHGSNAMITVNA